MMKDLEIESFDRDLAGWPVVLRIKDGEFCLIIAEISVVAVADTLDGAYQNLKSQVSRLRTEAKKWDLEAELKLPVEQTRIQSFFTRWGGFALKVLIVCLLAGTTMVVSARMVVQEVGRLPMNKIVRTGLDAFVSVAEKTFDAPSDSARSQSLRRLDRFVENAEPYSHRLWKLFPAPSAVATKAKP